MSTCKQISPLSGEEQSLGSCGALCEARWICRGKPGGKHVPQVLAGHTLCLLTSKSSFSSKLTFTFSTGNLNVSSGVAGSRAGSESKDLPKGNWKERRASTSDLKVLFTLLRVHQL